MSKRGSRLNSARNRYHTLFLFFNYTFSFYFIDNTIIDSITNECITLLETMVDAPESRDRDSTSFNPRREALISQMLSLSDMYAIFGNIAPSFKDNKTQKRILRVLGRGTRHR